VRLWEDFKAWQAASAHLHKQHAAEIMEQQIQCAHITIVNKLNQLLDEQEEYDAMHHKSTETGKRHCPASDRGKKCDLHKEKEMGRQDHYLEWLSMQNVLHSMRYNDLRNTGRLNIPNHDLGEWAIALHGRVLVPV